MPFSVLVVEDDPDTRANLRDILELDGYQVEEAGTAAEALARRGWGRYGAILLDRRLPDGTAESLLPRLRQEAPDAAVIVVTGHADVQGAISAFRLGAADYALKPINPDELRTRLGRIARSRRDREALREREEELRAVLDALPVGIWFTDSAGRIVYGNPAGQQIWGGARYVGVEGYGEYKGWRPGTTQRIEPHRWALARALRGETSLEEQIEIEAFDGARKVILNSAVPLRAADGTVRGAVVINQDVTERMRAEGDLRRAKERLERTLQEVRLKEEELRSTTQQLWQAARLAGVGELAASLAHELNNPLATVSLRVEGALAKTPPDDPRRRALEIIDQEVRRMARLVANLLGFSRAGRDQVSAVDLGEEAGKAIELVEHHLSRRRVRAETDFSPEARAVYADRQQVRQVLLNLLTNAGDAMPGGGVLTVRVRPGQVAGRPATVIEVADTGTGIPPEDLPRIFDPFFTTKDEGKGTGLGLAICKRIVDQHQGVMEVESAVGAGTTFRVTLPVRTAADPLGSRHG